MNPKAKSPACAIPVREPATVSFSCVKGRKFQLEGLVAETDFPACFLVFPPDTLPEIDVTKPCTINSRDGNGNSVRFSAKINEIRNKRIVELNIGKLLQPEEQRDFFRVNIRVPINVYYKPQAEDAGGFIEIGGETVDISQSGVLAILTEEFREGLTALLEISLPNPSENVVCNGRAVRSVRKRRDRWLTAFQFDSLSRQQRDLIAQNCFAEQRRQLRENIKTSG